MTSGFHRTEGTDQGKLVWTQNVGRIKQLTDWLGIFHRSGCSQPATPPCSSIDNLELTTTALLIELSTTADSVN